MSTRKPIRNTVWHVHDKQKPKVKLKVEILAAAEDGDVMTLLTNSHYIRSLYKTVFKGKWSDMMTKERLCITGIDFDTKIIGYGIGA